MARKAPGRCCQKGPMIMEPLRMMPDDTTAEKWFEEQRWPDCGSPNTVACRDRRPMPYRCRDCRRHFSVRKGTTMQSSKVSMREWVVGIHPMSANLKGTASMRVCRDLGMRQGTARFMMQRIRKGFDEGMEVPFRGPIKANETCAGVREGNNHAGDRPLAGRGPVGKTAVAGIKDRETKQVSASVVGKGLRYRDPVADNGLPSEARIWWKNGRHHS